MNLLFIQNKLFIFIYYYLVYKSNNTKTIIIVNYIISYTFYSLL